MNKLLLGLVLGASLLLSGCAEHKVIDNVNYAPYGLFNEDIRKDPRVQYEVSAGSVILAIIFIETVVVPVYIIGWDLFEPVQVKK